MKSCFRICVVLSTMLVLGASNPQNYHQRPGNYQQRWNQHQPQNLQARQWPSYQQAPAQSVPGLDTANYQHFQKYPNQSNSHGSVVVVRNVNEVPQEVIHANHTHIVRKIRVPLSELDKYKGARIIHLKDTGNPNDIKIIRVVGHDETVYEGKDIPDSLKDTLARALADRSESAAVHEAFHEIIDPVKVQTVNAQNKNFASRPAGSPRNRFGSGSNKRPIAGYTYRRRRPFQINHNIPIQGVRRPAQVLNNDNIKVATADNIEVAEKLPVMHETKNVANNDVVQLIARDEKPRVKSEPIVKHTTNHTQSDETLPSDEDRSNITLSTSVMKPVSVSKETSDDDSIESISERLSSTSNDDEDFPYKSHGRTLLTTTDDSNSEIVSVTEPTVSVKDLVVRAIKPRLYKTLPHIKPTLSTDDINSAFIDNEKGKPDITDNNNSNIISSVNKTEPTPISKASMKSLATIVVSEYATHPHPALDSSNTTGKSSRPYVIISPFQKEGNTTIESALFKKLMSYIIGKYKNNSAKVEVKDETENPHKDDKGKSPDVSEENTVITSDEATTKDKKETLTPISFVTSLVENALKGGDSLKKLFGEKRVKDFIASLFKTK